MDQLIESDHKNHPWIRSIKWSSNLPKLPDQLEESLDKLNNSREMKEAFGDDVIASYIKLKNQEIDKFNKDEIFDNRKPVSSWEKDNTLDC